MNTKILNFKKINHFLFVSILIAAIIFLTITIFPFLNSHYGAVKTFDNGTVSHVPRIALKKGTSVNWAGYAVETNLTTPQKKAVSDVKGQWVVPAVTQSNTNSYSAIWVGIDGYSNNTVEQIGTEQDFVNGTPRYLVWYEMYPQPSRTIDMSIKPGDIISAEVQYKDKGNFLLTIKNLTTGQTFSTTQKSNKAQLQSAEWIVEAPWSGGVLPLANFGTVNLSSSEAALNNQIGTISNSSWQNDKITMVSSDGTIVKALPSDLSSDGSSFSVQWCSN